LVDGVLGESLLVVENTSVFYRSPTGLIKALDDVSISVAPREFIALVGESGCGKSTLGLSILRLLPPNSEIRGNIYFRGVDLGRITNRELINLRGTGIGMIFQEPLSSLDPMERIRDQFAQTIQIYNKKSGMDKSKANNEEILKWLRQVRIPDPERSLDRYPFQLSGGMAQRVMIAMALSQNPSILIADEPTSALDVTTQAQIIQLMKDLASNTTIIFITHDLGVAAQVAEKVLVMYAGCIVEEGTAKQIFSNPLHPYTQALLGCYPRSSKATGKLKTINGTVPNLASEFKGCKFADRCPYKKEPCVADNTPIVEVEMGHRVRCILY